MTFVYQRIGSTVRLRRLWRSRRWFSRCRRVAGGGGAVHRQGFGSPAEAVAAEDVDPTGGVEAGQRSVVVEVGTVGFPADGERHAGKRGVGPPGGSEGGGGNAGA